MTTMDIIIAFCQEENHMMHGMRNFAEARVALHAYVSSRPSERTYTLDRMMQLMAYLGHPQDTLKIMHVAGTSGKSSTAYYAAALLMAAGKRVGLTVSPHAVEVNDRVQINLTPLPEQTFCQELSAFLGLVTKSGITPTYFELLIAFAYWEFVCQRVDYAVVEVGLGGLLDATNVITRRDKVCLITDIGLDHMRVLGSTLPAIAAQKAGIVQLHNTVFCYRQDDSVMEAIRTACVHKQAELHILEHAEVPQELHGLPLFQQRNFGLARGAVQFVCERDGDAPLAAEAWLKAGHVHIPARMETFQHDEKTLILDGAHNAQKLHTLGESIRVHYPGQGVAVLVSFVAGHEHRVTEGMKAITGLAQHIIVTEFAGAQDFPHHSVAPEAVIAACQQQEFTAVEVVSDPAQALKALLERPEPIQLVAGSFYLLNHIRPLVLHMQEVVRGHP